MDISELVKVVPLEDVEFLEFLDKTRDATGLSWLEMGQIGKIDVVDATYFLSRRVSLSESDFDAIGSALSTMFGVQIYVHGSDGITCLEIDFPRRTTIAQYDLVAASAITEINRLAELSDVVTLVREPYFTELV